MKPQLVLVAASALIMGWITQGPVESSAQQTPWVVAEEDCIGGSCPMPRPRPIVNAVVGVAEVAKDVTAAAAKTTGAVVHAALPPYRVQENYGSVGNSTQENYGSAGYSSTVYSSESYGSAGYSESQHHARRMPLRNIVRAQPVRSVLRRVCGR